MFVLVNTFPAPVRPDAVARERRAGWAWLATLEDQGELIWAHPKLGRGMVALFDVPSLERLQVLLTQWGEFVPCTFEVTPLVDGQFQQEVILGMSVQATTPESDAPNVR